jgi:hypothetical protein
MRCIYCNTELTNFIMGMDFGIQHTNLGSRATHNAAICTNHQIRPVYRFLYPSRFKKDLDIIWLWGNIFTVKLMIRDNKTHVWQHTSGDEKVFKTIFTLSTILGVTPETVDAKVKSLLVFM